MDRPFKDWSENDLQCAIWMLSINQVPKGGHCDVELYRQELILRGLNDRGWHNS